MVGEKWRKPKPEFSGGSSSVGRLKGDVVVPRRERSPVDKWRGGAAVVASEEVEEGEFVMDRWPDAEPLRDELSGYSRGRRAGADSERRRYDRDWTPPPALSSSVKYSGGEDGSPGREYSRSGNRLHSKRAARWEANNLPKLSSKNMENEYSHGRRDYSHSYSSKKRQGTDSDSSDRKGYNDDFGDYVTSKSRRVSGESGPSSAHSEKRNSRSSAFDRLSGRNYDSVSTRVGQDRYRRSPSYSERSPPRERARYHDHRDRTPARQEQSPGYRGHRHETRGSPSYSERSPHDRSKGYDRRDRSPSYLEQSPHDRSRPINHKKSSRKSGGAKSKKNDKVQEGKPLTERSIGSNDRVSTASAKETLKENEFEKVTTEKSVSKETNMAHELRSPSTDSKEQSAYTNGVVEELPSMEEDMDICDTPPHVPSSSVANLNPGKWYYIDHFGEERGPSRLLELKALVEGGVLMSDHLVKHSDSDRWVTVENAASPLVTTNYTTTVFSDSVTQLVSPPEAPGNDLVNGGDGEQCGDQARVEGSDDLGKRIVEELAAEDLSIDERVGALLEGFTVVPGKELEVVGEVLQITFDESEWEKFGSNEGIIHVHPRREKFLESNQEEDMSRNQEVGVEETAGCSSTASLDKDCGYVLNEFTEWFSGRWTCKGGDWQRNDEAVQDKFSRKKIVLSNGYPLCQMPKSGYEDPRWQQKDDLYFPCQNKKLDLPPWAFCWPDERADSNVVNKPGQVKAASRGVKGTMMLVIRINACVVKDQGSFVSDSRLKPRGKDKYSIMGTNHYSLSNDVKEVSMDDVHSKSFEEQSSVRPEASCVINKPKDRVCTADDLQLQIGDWYYLDGVGYECGPFSCLGLLKLVDNGSLKMQNSVFRKIDKVWVPVSSVIKHFQESVKHEEVIDGGESSDAPLVLHGGSSLASSLFHDLHPQFIGYTLGKLHELVMKSYKSREFAAAINEVLDPWIVSRQPKKEMERQLYNNYVSKGNEALSLYKDDIHARKRCRTFSEGVEEGCEMSGALQRSCYSDPSFEDLCGNITFCREEYESSETQAGSWGLLDGHILARIFHFLRADVKSLVFSALTCKHWRAAAGFYRNVSVRVDLSAVGLNCSDFVVKSVMNGYNKQMIKALVLEGCINITSTVLEEILQSFSSVCSVDIRGCSQLDELIIRFPHVTWVKDRSIVDVSSLRMQSSKQMVEQTSSFSKSSLVTCMDESSGLKDYFDMVEKRGAANEAFRRNLYKRTKLFDTRKSASVLAREARMRHWAMKKAGSEHRKMEEFLVLSLKDIMKANTSDYFVRKVAIIESRVKSGYYARRGLSSAKQDIIKMCREAIKMKDQADGGGMEHVIPLFIKLGTRLDESFRPSSDRDLMTKKSRDEAYGSSGYKKSSKTVTERNNMSWAIGTSVLNGNSEYMECSSEHKIRKKLSRLKKKLDSESDSSDEFDYSSDDSGTVSDTASDSDMRSEGSAFESKQGYLATDETFEFISDDREWGARMTKASLVPPVTRKYEVIDRYVIVADEVEVLRKMRVSLPDNYEEKVKAQKNGSEEVDMDFPEVKDFKPRKQLGEEVVEQEVYGIDPYTHNLLLDSMPEDVEWSLTEKRMFIEDVVLRVLNKQVRHYTGSGNTPMTYPLRPVFEEIMEAAKQEKNMRTVKLCESVLQAIDSRHEDNYVGYRKGLGVVCNKEGGFTEDDFVVEFLGEVYPSWKWFEKQDGIRSLQKNNIEPATEFYNIQLERPKGDADGYDLVVVDAMHKANYASRICHSCRPNCEAKVTAVDGQYQIGIYSIRPIGFGEEITFDYNSVTESKEEYEASVCLCGSQVCRGSYLNLTGEGAYQKVMKEWHGLLDRLRLLFEACELNWVSEEDYIDLGKAGLGSCLLGGLPDWLIAYSARLVRFINLERSKLPDEIVKHSLDDKKKYYAEISVEIERSDAEIQAEGVYNQRLQNLAQTLDKVRYVLRCVFGDPKKAPPPLRKLSSEEMISVLWKGDGSLVEELLECMSPHVDNRTLQDLKSKIRSHDPSCSSDVEKELRKSLLWLRDEVRDLDCSDKCRHDAAADLIHIYAYTKSFYKIRGYKSVTSPPVYISPLDLGPKYANKLPGVSEYCKTYGENYCLGQLIYWNVQTNAEPDRLLAQESRGCLSLPEIGSFYTKAQKPSRKLVYGGRSVGFLLSRMEKNPQKPWPTDMIWSFRSTPKIFGSPMLDAVVSSSQLERDMVNWLKNRPAMYHGRLDC